MTNQIKNYWFDHFVIYKGIIIDFIFYILISLVCRTSVTIWINMQLIVHSISKGKMERDAN